jgi:hypothetical protein
MCRYMFTAEQEAYPSTDGIHIDMNHLKKGEVK